MLGYNEVTQVARIIKGKIVTEIEQITITILGTKWFELLIKVIRINGTLEKKTWSTEVIIEMFRVTCWLLKLLDSRKWSKSLETYIIWINFNICSNNWNN